MLLSEGGLKPWDISRLTPREMRRLLEGRRVHHKIQKMIQDAQMESGGDSRKTVRAVGRKVPRASDERLLREYADKMNRGEATRAGSVN